MTMINNWIKFQDVEQFMDKIIRGRLKPVLKTCAFVSRLKILPAKHEISSDCIFSVFQKITA